MGNIDGHLIRCEERCSPVVNIFVRGQGTDADRVHWLGEPSQIFIATTLFLVLRLIITELYELNHYLHKFFSFL